MFSSSNTYQRMREIGKMTGNQKLEIVGLKNNDLKESKGWDLHEDCA